MKSFRALTALDVGLQGIYILHFYKNNRISQGKKYSFSVFSVFDKSTIKMSGGVNCVKVVLPQDQKTKGS